MKPPNGGGKYEAEVTAAREATQATLAMLIVIDGYRGTGFAVQSTDHAVMRTIPSILRRVATAIEGKPPAGKKGGRSR